MTQGGEALLKAVVQAAVEAGEDLGGASPVWNCQAPSRSAVALPSLAMSTAAVEGD
jgi:hypothetical protein